jgi:ABC-type amino acid transport substrate-binding protein
LHSTVEAALSRIGLSAKTAIVDAGQFTPSLHQPVRRQRGRVEGPRARACCSSPVWRIGSCSSHGEADIVAKALADLKGKRVAIVEGYSYGDTIDAAGPAFVRSRSEEDSLARLLNGGVDYTLMDELVVQYIVLNYPKESGATLQIGSRPLLSRSFTLP